MALTLLAASQLRALQLQTLEGNPGVLPVKEGSAVISSEKWTLIKRFDLKLVSDDLLVNSIKLNELNGLVDANWNKSYVTLVFNNFRIQTDYIRNKTLDKYRQLVPSYRIRRGIINPLGSIIKIITGNLDIEDAHRYDKLIENIISKENHISKKVTLISEVVDGLYNATHVVNNNVLQLNRKIKDIQNNLEAAMRLENEHYYSIMIINLYSMILHNFQTISLKLSNIETAIAFSKLNVLHQSIIESDNFLKIIKDIEKTDRLAFPAIPENVVKIEQSIDIKSFIKENQLTFILEIPLINKETYVYYKLYPLPVLRDLKTYIILPKYPYLIVNGLTSKPLSQPCEQLSDSKYICFEEISQYIEDPCISDLIKFVKNTSTCTLIPIKYRKVVVHKIQKNRWIIFTDKETVIQYSCGNEVHQENIQGTYILTIENECEVKIDKHILKLRPHQMIKVKNERLPIVHLPHINPKEKVEERHPIELDDLDLGHIDSVRNLITSDNDYKSEVSEIRVKSVSVWTIILYLIIAVVGVFIFYIRLRKLGYTCNFQDSPNHTNSDNLESQEGEVMRPGSGPVPFTIRVHSAHS